MVYFAQSDYRTVVNSVILDNDLAARSYEHTRVSSQPGPWSWLGMQSKTLMKPLVGAVLLAIFSRVVLGSIGSMGSVGSIETALHSFVLMSQSSLAGN
jgi:hypothetical protein